MTHHRGYWGKIDRIILLAACLTVATLACCAQAQAAVPTLDVDVIPTPPANAPASLTRGIDSGGDSNGWGVHQDKIARDSKGNLYATYVVNGADLNHNTWVLVKRPAGSTQWQYVASGPNAYDRNGAQVLIGPDDTVYVVFAPPFDSATSGGLMLWDSRSGQALAIPGRWLTGTQMQNAGSLYMAAGIDHGGDLSVSEDVPCPYQPGVTCLGTNTPGTYDEAVRSGGGTWTTGTFTTPSRVSYGFEFPQSSSAFTMVGQRDVQQNSEAPYNCPNGSGYCFDQAVLATSSGTATVIRAAVDQAGYTGDHRVSPEDVIMGSDGNYRVIVSVLDASTNGVWQNHLMEVSPTGKLLRDVQEPLLYANQTRIVQDAGGDYWLYTISAPPGPVTGCQAAVVSGGSDGFSFGSVTTLPFPASLGLNCATEDRQWDAAPRNGSGWTNTIDALVTPNQGAYAVHAQITLPTNVPPSPPPPPPNPTPTPTSLAVTTGKQLCDAVADSPYKTALKASGGTPPYTWSVNGAGPPAGISLAADGTLSGTPQTKPDWNIPGWFVLDLKVTDSSSPAQSVTTKVGLEVAGSWFAPYDTAAC